MSQLLLTIPCAKIWPGDSLQEGTRVGKIEFGNGVTTFYSYKARWVYELGPDGQHIHSTSLDPVEAPVIFLRDGHVRVVRPAPMEPCECGFPG